MKLYDIIIESAEKALEKISNHHMPPGHDGPHFDVETPVRNTSHWLLTFQKAYEITKEKKYFIAVEELANYLISTEARPMDAAFFHRKNPNKDFSNNLIGQAWTIEALIAASKLLKNKKYENIAKEVFLIHKFNKNMGLWERRNVDGSYNTIDETFNHQLWFAAICSTLNVNKDSFNFFMDMIPKQIIVKNKGLIYIPIKRDTNKIGKKIFGRIITIWNLLEDEINNYKAIGYHAFHLYGFALLFNNLPDHSLWKSRLFKKILLYPLREEFEKKLDDTFTGRIRGKIPLEDKTLIHNRYGFAYNPPGFEIAYALLTFKDYLPSNINTENLASYWVSKQINRCYNFKTKMMEKNTEDSKTLSARLYEATRLPNFDLSLNFEK